MPQVSVVIPTFNRPVYLRAALQSVLVQTHKDFEILVVDDGSTDDIGSVVRDLADPCLRYLRSESNSGGPASPMSWGAKEAQGDFIAFLDHDDLVRAQWLSLLSEALVNHPKAGIAWGQHAVFMQPGVVDTVAFRQPFGDGPKKPLPIFLRWTPGTSGLMVRRSLFDEIGFFDPSVGGAADYDWTVRFATETTWGVAYVPEIVLDYRVHGENTSSGVSVKSLAHLERFYQKHHRALIKYPELLGDFVYRLAWTNERLGHKDRALQHIRQALLANPGNRKFRLFKSLVKYGIWRYLRPLVEAKSWASRRYRYAKHAWRKLFKS